jgi:hypothetical protein
MPITQAIQRETQVFNSVSEYDVSIRLRLAAKLIHSPFANYDLGCDFCEGVVVLRGRVHSFHEKQLVQELARKVDGVKIVVNRLVVDRS